jgi:hypothetical protein
MTLQELWGMWQIQLKSWFSPPINPQGGTTMERLWHKHLLLSVGYWAVQWAAVSAAALSVGFPMVTIHSLEHISVNMI